MSEVARWSLLFDYLRASGKRLLGAELGSKVRVASGCEASRWSGVRLGARAVVEPGVVFKLVDPQASLEAGAHVFIGRGTQFDLSGVMRVGDGTLIAPGCFFVDHNHGIAPTLPIWRQPCSHRPVIVGADVWIGAKVVVLPGVTIGDGAVVAAGSVVTRDVASMTIVAGVPARLVRMRT